MFTNKGAVSSPAPIGSPTRSGFSPFVNVTPTGSPKVVLSANATPEATGVMVNQIAIIEEFYLPASVNKQKTTDKIKITKEKLAAALKKIDEAVQTAEGHIRTVKANIGEIQALNHDNQYATELKRAEEISHQANILLANVLNAQEMASQKPMQENLSDIEIALLNVESLHPLLDTSLSSLQAFVERSRELFETVKKTQQQLEDEIARRVNLNRLEGTACAQESTSLLVMRDILANVVAVNQVDRTEDRITSRTALEIS